MAAKRAPNGEEGNAMNNRMMASEVVTAMIFIATGSAQAGMVGHVSAVPIGPALMHRSGGEADAVGAGRAHEQPKEGMKSSEYQREEAVETGKLSERKGFESNETPVEEIGGRLYRKGVDTGP
jgi:hypothetical protein